MCASQGNQVFEVRKVNQVILVPQVSVDEMVHRENVVNLDLLVTRVHKDLVVLK